LPEKRILVTGANGMLGENCVRLLMSEGVLLATDLHPQLITSMPVNYRPLNITATDEVHTVLTEFRPDWVVNCAAYTGVDGSENHREKAWEVNVTGVRNIVDNLLTLGGQIIQISTDYVFDGQSGPYDENAAVNPINYYGQTKLASEHLIVESGLPYVILRTNVLFGNATNPSASFVHWVVTRLTRHEFITVVTDQYGNPTWTNGLAEAIRQVIRDGKTGLFNYGGADYVNRYDFALQIADIYQLEHGYIKPITTRELNQKAPRPLRAGLVCEKIKNTFGFELYTLKEALIRMRGA